MSDQLPAINSKRLIENQTIAGRGRVFVDLKSLKTVNASVRGTGAVSATINILGSNLPETDTYVVIATITLSGNNLVVDSFVADAPWAYTCAELVSITGTSATANAAAGV